jgi:hypothetical protein
MSGFDPEDLKELNKELATRLRGDCGGDCIIADDRAKTLGAGGEFAGLSPPENASAVVLIEIELRDAMESRPRLRGSPARSDAVRCSILFSGELPIPSLLLSML